MLATQIRNPGVTEFRRLIHVPGMAASNSTVTNPRTLAFIAWMTDRGLNPNRVAVTSGVPYNTILDFVKGRTYSLTDSNAARIAVAFSLSVEELFGYGDANSHRSVTKDRTIPVVGYVGAASQFYGLDDHENGFGLDEIDAPPGVPEEAVAVIVRGDSGYPAIRDGMVLIFWNKMADPSSVEGEDCFVRLTDGRTLVKILERGNEPGKWTLTSMNASTPPIRNVDVEWAAPIEIRLRRKNWKGGE